MSSKNKKRIVFPVFFMVLVAAVFTTVLASLNAVTAERIQRQDEAKHQRSLLYVFNQKVPQSLPEIQGTYNGLIEKTKWKNMIAYKASKNKKLIGYAFPFQGSGLWGTVWGYVAISSDFSKILGVDFIKHSETPGLGGRISEDWFRDQFRGVSLEKAKEPIVYRPLEEGNADVISGATLTSVAVRNMLNEKIMEILKEER